MSVQGDGRAFNMPSPAGTRGTAVLNTDSTADARKRVQWDFATGTTQVIPGLHRVGSVPERRARSHPITSSVRHSRTEPSSNWEGGVSGSTVGVYQPPAQSHIHETLGVTESLSLCKTPPSRYEISTQEQVDAYETIQGERARASDIDQVQGVGARAAGRAVRSRILTKLRSRSFPAGRTVGEAGTASLSSARSDRLAKAGVPTSPTPSTTAGCSRGEASACSRLRPRDLRSSSSRRRAATARNGILIAYVSSRTRDRVRVPSAIC